MWHDMFALPVPVSEKILRALFIYVFLVLALRVAGKRELAQLSTFDFVVLLSVANAVQNGIIGNDDSVTGAWIGAMTLFIANFFLAFAIVRSRRLRKAAEGAPTTVMEHGQYCEDNLKKMRVTDVEVESAIRANALRVHDIDKVEIYPNGRVAMTPKEPDSATEHFEQIQNELREIRALLEARR